MYGYNQLLFVTSQRKFAYGSAALLGQNALEPKWPNKAASTVLA